MTQIPANEDMVFTFLAERYSEPLDEARKNTISNNLVTFFKILNEWDMKQTVQEVTLCTETPGCEEFAPNDKK